MRLLQEALLWTAERWLGPRDAAWSLCLPSFVEDGPKLRHAPREKVVWAELSLNAGKHWPTAVFELAHEVVHLLNPVKGHTNYLEEGIAVAFQLYVAPAFSGEEIPVPDPDYQEAEQLVRQLGTDVLLVAKTIRQRFSRLSGLSAEQLQGLFAAVPFPVLSRLASECQPGARA